ncbi:MAG: hypothetical protein IPP44_08090 [Ideonella sp.]|nr:hypothetical protein [Ideonella sp.]
MTTSPLTAEGRPAAVARPRVGRVRRLFDDRSCPRRPWPWAPVVLAACGVLAWMHQQADHATVLTALATGLLAVVACAWLASRTGDALLRVRWPAVRCAGMTPGRHQHPAHRAQRRVAPGHDAPAPHGGGRARTPHGAARSATPCWARSCRCARTSCPRCRTRRWACLKTDLHELVDEALKALEQTLDYGSASVWSREHDAGRARGVDGLSQCRHRRDRRTHPGPAGMRLSRPNVQHYEQIERERESIIENNARQSLLSWLWAKVVDDPRTSALYRTTRAWMGVLLVPRPCAGRVAGGPPGTRLPIPERARLLTAVCSQTALAIATPSCWARSARWQWPPSATGHCARSATTPSQTLFASTWWPALWPASPAAMPGRQCRPAQAGADAGAIEPRRLAEMRMLMYELRPDALAQTPLSELLQLAIEALVCRGDIQVDTSLSKDDPLPVETRLQQYRIAQEALSNIGKRSAATHAVVQWQFESGKALLHCRRRPRFRPAAAAAWHFGLGKMAERAREIGASHT